MIRPGFIACACILLASCFPADKEVGDERAQAEVLDCGPAGPSFEQDVLPIFAEHCGPCHTEKKEGDVLLTTHASAVTAARRVDFLNSLKQIGGALPMPQGKPKLPQDRIDVIECWMRSGFQKN